MVCSGRYSSDVDVGEFKACRKDRYDMDDIMSNNRKHQFQSKLN